MAPVTLLDILSNEYLLLHTTPYLLPTELLALGLCSRSYCSLITHSRSVWRHLNLSVSPRAIPASTTAIAQRTQTPLYQTELNRLLSKPFVLRDVKTLILDGLPVTVDLLHDLLSSPTYRIQLLSIRECTSHINERQLMLLFQYLVRTTRETPPTLKGCYFFGDMDSPGGIFPSASKPRDPSAKGRFIKPGKLNDDWVDILTACKGTIAFDTRVCTGPRHEEGHDEKLKPKLASIRLAGGCAECKTSPEAQKGKGLRDLPKVVCAPVPLMSSDIRIACQTPCKQEEDILRCDSCAHYCERCGKWWCESCLAKGGTKKFVSLDCYDCGMLCADCTRDTSRTCKSCRGEYCVTHNTGADNNWCEWCNSPERRFREFNRSRVDQVTRTRTLARLNAIRSSFGVARFKDEAIVRNRCTLLAL